MNARPADGPAYRAIWRWHFYAGLFCVPFVLWLAITGSIYLWKPQIEALIDRPYDHLALSGAPAPAAAQVSAAVAEVPGSALRAYELPPNPDAAVRVIVASRGEASRVYVHPQSLAILKTVAEEDRPMAIIFRLHGELMLGDRGSIVVELAASWAILMILTGLYLWWPRGRGPAGVLWPRIGARGRVRWRDLHAVTGLWVSLFALLLLVSGLPWAKSWGAYLDQIRAVTGTSVATRDWPTGGAPRPIEDHSEHGGGTPAPAISHDDTAIDLVVAAARQLDFAGPVMIQPPKRPGGDWTVKSDAANRPLRATATIDPISGAVVTREDFADRHAVDRVVGYGVAMHEGQLFGLANQLLGQFTALGLMLVSISAYTMWWRRRPKGKLGAPIRHAEDRLPWPAKAGFIALGLLLPLLGATALLVLGADKLLMRLRTA